MNERAPESGDIDALYDTLKREGEAAGYHLNPDAEFSRDLVKGLIVNERRYGYRSCPCRLASGDKSDDLDIVCPCDYRDEDLTEFGACYCALYVSREVASGTRKAASIPERRKPKGQRRQTGVSASLSATGALSQPVWRCKVCGYLCARPGPPETCPICKAKGERFERFIDNPASN